MKTLSTFYKGVLGSCTGLMLRDYLNTISLLMEYKVPSLMKDDFKHINQLQDDGKEERNEDLKIEYPRIY